MFKLGSPRARILTVAVPNSRNSFNRRRTPLKRVTKTAGRKQAFRGKDFLSVDDFTPEQIKSLFKVAADMKARPRKYRRALDGKMMALIFEKPSLRTRTTFTVGIKQLGGDSLLLTPADINLGKRESVYDVAKNLERMVHGIMIRTFGHDICTKLAEYAAIPVINGLTDLEHPCQALGDFFTIRECKKNLKKLKLCYVGDGNNVAHSLILTAAKLGATFYVATPEAYQPAGELMQRAREIAESTGATVQWTAEPGEAVRDSDMVYTDTWASMGQEGEAEARRKVFAPYQVNNALFSMADPEALFMHCLPAHRGEEVTDQIIDSPNSVVFQQAENRLHVQKAIMFELLRD
ncbi:MAG: ornithine carbamoyltransferase [Bacteroidetes bacterium]|nr:ornithine carbamoyltransferase [Bacteroidota bacterium]